MSMLRFLPMMGPMEGFLVVVTLALRILPIVGGIDAALKPDAAWQAADQNKVVWVLLQVVGALIFALVGFIAALVYFFAIRPKVVAGEGHPRDRLSP